MLFLTSVRTHILVHAGRNSSQQGSWLSSIVLAASTASSFFFLSNATFLSLALHFLFLLLEQLQDTLLIFLPKLWILIQCVWQFPNNFFLASTGRQSLVVDSDCHDGSVDTFAQDIDVPSRQVKARNWARFRQIMAVFHDEMK